MSNPPTLMFFGDPGVGKTFGIVDVAKELEAEYIPLSLGRLEAYDIKAAIKSAITAAQAGRRVIVHCDEPTLADEAVQGAVLDVVLQKTIDDLKLPDSIQFIFTSNMGGGENSLFAKILTSALIGGIGFIYEVKPPEIPGIEEWLNYQEPDNK